MEVHALWILELSRYCAGGTDFNLVLWNQYCISGPISLARQIVLVTLLSLPFMEFSQKRKDALGKPGYHNSVFNIVSMLLGMFFIQTLPALWFHLAAAQHHAVTHCPFLVGWGVRIGGKKNKLSLGVG